MEGVQRRRRSQAQESRCVRGFHYLLLQREIDNHSTEELMHSPVLELKSIPKVYASSQASQRLEANHRARRDHPPGPMHTTGAIVSPIAYLYVSTSWDSFVFHVVVFDCVLCSVRSILSEHTGRWAAGTEYGGQLTNYLLHEGGTSQLGSAWVLLGQSAMIKTRTFLAGAAIIRSSWAAQDHGPQEQTHSFQMQQQGNDKRIG